MDMIQTDEHEAERLGSSLRHDSRKNMRRRRGVFGLFLAASASMGVVALYQMGILKHVPEPPLALLDSDGITGSGRAYSILATPDAVLALESYATTMALAAMGSPNRTNEQPAVPIVLAAKVGFDAIMAVKYTIDELKEHREACFWCLLASAAVIASVPLAIPEANQAFRRLISS